MQAKILSFNVMTLVVMIVVGLIMLEAHSMVKGEADTTVKQLACFGSQYDQAYGDALKEALDSLVDQTPKVPAHIFFKNSGTPPIVYGRGNCRGSLSEDDCSFCLRKARSATLYQCDGQSGAQTVLVDCDISFQDQEFD